MGKDKFEIIHKMGMSETVGGNIGNNHQKQSRVHNDGPKQQQHSPSQCCGKFFSSVSDIRIIGWWLCSSAVVVWFAVPGSEFVKKNKWFLSSRIRNTVYLLAEKNTKGILVVDCILLWKCGKCWLVSGELWIDVYWSVIRRYEIGSSSSWARELREIVRGKMCSTLFTELSHREQIFACEGELKNINLCCNAWQTSRKAWKSRKKTKGR